MKNELITDTSSLISEAFCLAPVEYELEFTSGGFLDEAPGVALRGALGYALRNIARNHSDTPFCNCASCRIFCHEPRPAGKNEDGSARLADLPPRFTLEIEGFDTGKIRPRDTATLRIRMAGDNPEDLADIDAALNSAGMQGIGGPRATFTTARLQAPAARLDKQTVLSMAAQFAGHDTVEIEFSTPAFIRLSGERRFGLSFGELVGSIMNRLHHGLAHHWGDHDIAARTRDLRNRLIEQARDVIVDKMALVWVPQERWRHYRAKQTLSGFAGAIRYRGNLDPFWPLIIAGCYTHIGYGAAMGLGRYNVGIFPGNRET